MVVGSMKMSQPEGSFIDVHNSFKITALHMEVGAIGEQCVMA
jgi:hypothetical protein